MYLILTFAIFVVMVAGALFRGTWFLSLAWWGRAAIAVPLTGALFGCIWQLNVKAEKTEPVWATGQSAVVWHAEDFPVEVAIDPTDPTKDQLRPLVAAALGTWNGAAGCTLFVLADAFEDPYNLLMAQVTVERGMIGTLHPTKGTVLAGGTWWGLRDDTPVFSVRIYEPGNPTHEYLILTHEFGRVLGLETDADRRSIMVNGVQRYQELPLPSPSRKDSKALNERYCSGRVE